MFEPFASPAGTRAASGRSLAKRKLRAMSLLRRVLWLVPIIVLASACRADFDVVVTVEENGSGIVEATTTIDAEAAAGLLESDDSGLLLADLAQSGWKVDRPERTAAGSTVVTATKQFGTPSQFAEVMLELTGDDGPIRDFTIRRTASFARVEYEVEGTIDTTSNLDDFADPDLEESLGRSLSAIAARYGATEDQINFRVEVLIPGELLSEAPTGLLASETGVRSAWESSLDSDEVVSVGVASATRQVSALVLRGVAVVAGVLAAVVVFAQLLRILLPDRRRASRNRNRPGPKKPVTATKPPAEQRADAAGDTPPVPLGPKVVALDGMGVLYREGRDIEKLLIPYVRHRGVILSDDEIRAKALTLSLGRMTTGQFWAALGAEGDPADLDEGYLSLFHLTPGVVKFLRKRRDEGARIACITNDAQEWALGLKARHNLEALIDPWVISGAVGARKPDLPLFEVLRRVTGEPPSGIQIIDDDLDILDAARDLGFATAWFFPEGSIADARDHPLIRRFDHGEEETGEHVTVTPDS